MWVMKIFFVEFFCVFLQPILNIICYCYVHTVSFFIAPIFAGNVPLVSLIFLKRSLVFPILLFFSVSLPCLLSKAVLYFPAILWNSAFRWYIFPFLLCLSVLFFSQLFVSPLQTTILPFCMSFSWGWF